MRPETTYADMRAADGNTGNVEENKSLYWHPTVYRVEDGIYKKAEMYLTSAYYIWTTGEATAFPDGFKMVAGFDGIAEARASFECVGCEADDEEECIYTVFPEESCVELEVSMAFPTCWDGVNIDSEDHMSHVSYDIEGGRFDGECPSSHPVKLPEIQLFFRILPYPGGTHVFADGTNYYHADYFSGWDSVFLQDVLDRCENYSDAASPDAWCEDFLTFRDAPKSFGEDDNIVEKLEALQPPTFDTSTITDEIIDNTSELPRGACTGTLKPEGPTAPTPTAPTPTVPTPTAPTPTAPTPTAPTPTAPTPTGDDDEGDDDESSCADSSLRFQLRWNGRKIARDCNWVANKATKKRCAVDGVSQMCPDTCESCSTCEDSSARFKLLWNGKKISRDCFWVGNRATRSRCAVEGVAEACRSTCEEC